jgi:hypothetical protein
MRITRPTAVLDGTTLYILCYPGTEYVRHYAALISTYLHITDHPVANAVWYVLPSEEACWEPILATQLADVPVADWLILGSGLVEISQSSVWQGTDRYLWTQATINDKSVTFLIFQHSFWGDILERITHHLIVLGHKNVIFTAKVGGIKEHHQPNFHLSTGSLSFVEGEIITWNNIFEKALHPQLQVGTQCH